jgi:hypothetical protein
MSPASIALWVVSPVDSNSNSMVAVIFIGSLHNFQAHLTPQSFASRTTESTGKSFQRSDVVGSVSLAKRKKGRTPSGP